jgi:hypothetical protein
MYPNGISKTVLILIFIIYFFTGGYSISLAITGASFYLKYVDEGVPTDVCGYITNATIANELKDEIQVCDVIYPMMKAASCLIGAFLALGLLFVVVKRLTQSSEEPPDINDENISFLDQLRYHFHDMGFVTNNCFDLLVLFFLVLFWIILAVPIFVRCANDERQMPCYGELLLRISTGVVSNLGSIGVIAGWIIVVFYGAFSDKDPERYESL